jgi:hypothetical protein
LIRIHGIAFVVMILICPKRRRDDLTQVNYSAFSGRKTKRLSLLKAAG